MPLLQVYVEAPLAVSITVPLIQIAVLVEAMANVGNAFTVMVTTATLVLVQPAVLVPVTE